MRKIHALCNFTNLTVVLFGIAILSFAGCGDSSIAPVSGKVTVAGEPVKGIRLVFSPVLSEDGTDPGPWSTGLTNSAGEYTLETRYKDNGAVVGQHTVAFVYDDIGHIDTFKELRREAKQDGDQAALAAVNKDIADYEARQKTRPKSSGDGYNQKFDVPSGGTKEANFDLPD